MIGTSFIHNWSQGVRVFFWKINLQDLTLAKETNAFSSSSSTGTDFRAASWRFSSSYCKISQQSTHEINHDVTNFLKDNREACFYFLLFSLTWNQIELFYFKNKLHFGKQLCYLNIQIQTPFMLISVSLLYFIIYNLHTCQKHV